MGGARADAALGALHGHGRGADRALPRGDYIAATIDTHNAPLSKDEEITVGHLPGPPPAIPDRDCTWPNPHGTVADLTWSPDASTLAWSDTIGVWTARFAVPAQTGQLCVVTAKRLLARKATSPDWSPAA